LNPAIDYYIHTYDLKIGSINQGYQYEYVPGGKGINVSIMLSRLNVKNKAFGFYGGKYGKLLMDLLDDYQIDADFTPIEAETRQNIKIRSEVETDINTIGPTISKFELNELVMKINSLNETDYLVLAGKSVVVEGIDVNDVIGQIAYQKNLKLIVDASGKDLEELIKYKPFLIKPNLEELEALTQRKLVHPLEMERVCQQLIQNYNITYVLLSLGQDGAMLVGKNKTYYEQAKEGKVLNTVGAGDALLAGFLATYTKTFDIEASLKMGVICGSASAFTNQLATIDEILKNFTNQEVTRE